AEEVDEAVALLVALLDDGLAFRELGPELREQAVESRERGRQLRDAERAQLRLVVEDDHVLARLREAPDRALAERLAVGRPAAHAPRGRRVELVPAVLPDVLAQWQDQLRL